MESKLVETNHSNLEKTIKPFRIEEDRSSRWQALHIIGFLKTFAKFTGKYMPRSLFSISLRAPA